MAIQYTDKVVLLNGVTAASTTSDPVDVSLRSQITIQLVASNIGSGNGSFAVNGSNDGTNYSPLSFRDGNGTAATTYVTSKVLSSNTSALIFVPAGMRFLEVVCTRTTDGTYSAIMEAAG